jgi:hypothetical protein
MSCSSKVLDNSAIENFIPESLKLSNQLTGLYKTKRTSNVDVFDYIESATTENSPLMIILSIVTKRLNMLAL